MPRRKSNKGGDMSALESGCMLIVLTIIGSFVYGVVMAIGVGLAWVD